MDETEFVVFIQRRTRAFSDKAFDQMMDDFKQRAGASEQVAKEQANQPLQVLGAYRGHVLACCCRNRRMERQMRAAHWQPAKRGSAFAGIAKPTKAH